MSKKPKIPALVRVDELPPVDNLFIHTYVVEFNLLREKVAMLEDRVLKLEYKEGKIPF